MVYEKRTKHKKDKISSHLLFFFQKKSNKNHKKLKFIIETHDDKRKIENLNSQSILKDYLLISCANEHKTNLNMYYLFNDMKYS